LRVQQFFPTVLEQLTVLNTRRTHLFARATAKTPIDVRAKRRRRVFKSSFRHGAHEIEPSAWSIILVAGDYVGGTRLEA